MPWSPGDVALFRYIRYGKVRYAAPHIVVQDDEDDRRQPERDPPERIDDDIALDKRVLGGLPGELSGVKHRLWQVHADGVAQEDDRQIESPPGAGHDLDPSSPLVLDGSLDLRS